MLRFLFVLARLGLAACNAEALSVAIGLTLLVAACGGDDWKPSRPGEIFRYTTVGRSLPLDTIALGRPWASAAKYGAKDGDTVTTLPSGTFGGADAIGVHRNTSGIVTSIAFAYRTENSRGLAEDYARTLGKPTSTVVDTVSGMVRTTAIWRNADTEFSVSTVSRPLPDGIGASAWLRDLGTRGQ